MRSPYRVPVAPLLVIVASLIGMIPTTAGELGPHVLFSPNTFNHAAPWHQMASSFQDRVVDGAIFPSTWAATVPFTSNDLDEAAQIGISRHSLPIETLRTLPSDGIVIAISSRMTGSAQEANTAWRPLTRRPPAAVTPSRIDPTWGETIGNPEVSLAVLRGQVRGKISEGGTWIEAWIFFGTRRPAPDVLVSANAELERLILIHC
jgi:hypothetical protein